MQHEMTSKIHHSWTLMNPNENEKYEEFKFEEYYERMKKIKKLQHIPKIIFEQWIYYLHYDPNTLKNYAWMNFENIVFELCEWGFDNLSKINVVDEFKEYVNLRAIYSGFEKFCCTIEDLEYWKKKGTWRIPPIILDINSLTAEIPVWCDLKPPFQLVEGHSRMGYLFSMKRISDLNKGVISSKHKIFLMKEI